MPPTSTLRDSGASSSASSGVGRQAGSAGRTRGYCAGVDRAVETVERALGTARRMCVRTRSCTTGTWWTRWPRPARCSSMKPTRCEGAIVVFSAHGVAPTVHTSAAERKLQVIDATCPLVTKVHNEAKRFARDDYDILLIGHEGHEEVVGTAGEAPDHVRLVDGPGGRRRDRARREQGDLAVADHAERRRDDGNRAPGCGSSRRCRIRPAMTSAATQNRQVAVKAMAPVPAGDRRRLA